MRWSISVVLVVITLVGLIAACGGGAGAPTPTPIKNIALSASFDGPPIDVASQNTKMHIGKPANVCGTVADHGTNPGGKPGTFLFFDYKYPNYTFYIHIEEHNRGNFPENLDSHYVGKQVCVTGTIQDWAGRRQAQKIQPHITVTEPSEIEFQS